MDDARLLLGRVEHKGQRHMAVEPEWRRQSLTMISKCHDMFDLRLFHAYVREPDSVNRLEPQLLDSDLQGLAVLRVLTHSQQCAATLPIGTVHAAAVTSEAG